MTATVIELGKTAIACANDLRARLAEADREVRAGVRKRPKPVKVGIALSERCNVRGIEARVISVAVTDAYVTVRNRANGEVTEIPTSEITSWEIL